MNSIDKEKSLIKRIISGDKRSFGDLVKNYKRLVAHIVYSNVKNQDDRDDLCQEIFLKIYVNLSTFKFKCKLSTWIGKIAYNSCLNFYNKRKMIYDLSYDEIEETVNTLEQMESDVNCPESFLNKKELHKIMDQKIQELPMRNQTVMILFHVDGFSYQEISEILNVSINNVKVMLFRSRKMLREKILAEYSREDLCL
ncbi:sigma-70 family RNA polymerase sigma factor [candidate division KSB1 bacterium]|nr:sigma-70 family RNA polymerase sigma factor [candidate division KSB1 bacterium]